MSRATVQTMPGTIKGKIAYMSPEQAAAWDVDGRSDLFSMGIVLFEVLTGARPFAARSDLELLRMLIEQPAPDPLSVDPTLPPALAAFLRKALANDRLDRFQSADEMARALLACGEGPPAGPTEVARLVASNARTEDAMPEAPVDPLAATVGRDRPASSSSPGTAETVTHAKDTVPSRPLHAPTSPRWPAAAVLALVVLAGGTYALWPEPEAAAPQPPVVVARPPLPVPVPVQPAPTPTPTPVPSEVVPAVVELDPVVPPEQPRKTPRAPKGKATIDVNSTPWARVYLDGTYVGDTALTSLAVSAGKHRLRLHNPTVNKAWETTLELASGEHRVIPVDLEAQGVPSK